MPKEAESSTAGNMTARLFIIKKQASIEMKRVKPYIWQT